MLRESAIRGYRVTCRKPRCSLCCYQGWRQKESAILQRLLLHHLPADDVTVYRGHLTLAVGATVADHQRIVGRFLRLIHTSEKATGHTCRVHLTGHVTAPDALHWDLLLYTTMSGRSVRTTVRESWTRAGGDRYSLAGIDTADERVRAAKYTTKDVTETKRKYVHLPADNGLNMTRYTATFWSGTTKDALWRECIVAWFGVPQPPEEVIVSNNDKPLYDHFTDRKLDRKTRDYAVALVRSHTPTSPDTALSLDKLSRRVSIPRDWLRNVLPNVHGVQTTSTGSIWRDTEIVMTAAVSAVV